MDAEYRILTGSHEERAEKLSAIGWWIHIQHASRATANPKTFAVGFLFRKLEENVEENVITDPKGDAHIKTHETRVGEQIQSRPKWNS